MLNVLGPLDQVPCIPRINIFILYLGKQPDSKTFQETAPTKVSISSGEILESWEEKALTVLNCWG